MYRVGTPIRIRYLELDKESGVSLYLIVQPPTGSEWSPILMTEIQQGLYEASFTPDQTGIWWVRVYSPTKPRNVYSKSYYVGNLDATVYGVDSLTSTPITPTVEQIFGHNRLSTVSTREILQICKNEKLFQSFCFINIPTQSETNLALLVNPSNSNKLVILHHILADIYTRGSQCFFYVYINPTVTDYGTQLSIFNRYIKQNPRTSSVLTYRSPIVSSRGTQCNIFSVGSNTNSLFLNLEGSMILDPGFSLLLTGIPSGNNTQVGFTLVWQEELKS